MDARFLAAPLALIAGRGAVDDRRGVRAVATARGASSSWLFAARSAMRSRGGRRAPVFRRLVGRPRARSPGTQSVRRPDRCVDHREERPIRDEARSTAASSGCIWYAALGAGPDARALAGGRPGRQWLAGVRAGPMGRPGLSIRCGGCGVTLLVGLASCCRGITSSWRPQRMNLGMEPWFVGAKLTAMAILSAVAWALTVRVVTPPESIGRAEAPALRCSSSAAR